MVDIRKETPGVAERTRAVAVDGAIVAAHFLDQHAVFVTGDEALVFVAADGAQRRIKAHAGAILSSASDGAHLVTGGDDGNVVATDVGGKTETLASDAKRRWIDHVALASDGAVAWAAGKSAFVKTAKGETRACDVASSVGGLAFAPKGFRLAISHYNGVSLWFPNAAAKPDILDWKGVHYAVAFSPDGRFLMTAMQEPMLHGWRLADSKHMRMSGYQTRVRSLAWTTGGQFLATSGSDQLILWPFQGKDGPMGKEPKLLAPHTARVAVVACHPKQPVVAVGYADGMVLLVRIGDGAEILAKRPGEAPVTALAFSNDGAQLAFGCEDGAAGLVTL